MAFSAVRVPLMVRARARLQLLEREQEVALAGPFVLLPALDPPPTPPADDQVVASSERHVAQGPAVGALMAALRELRQ